MVKNNAKELPKLPTIEDILVYSKEKGLTPPDLKRCEAEIHEYNAFRMGGSPMQITRCSAKPIYVVTEKKPSGKEKARGSMSLCAACYVKFVEKLGAGYATLQLVIRKGDIRPHGKE